MCAAWVRPERLVATRPAPASYAAEGLWPESSLGAVLDATVKAVPDGPAVVDGLIRLDYTALADEVNRVATGFRRLGVRAGDVVTVELPNWWETVVAMHAVLRIGAVLNPVVPIYRDHELRFIIAQSRPRVVVVPHRFRGFDYVEMLERVSSELDYLPAVVVIRAEDGLSGGTVTFEEIAAEPGATPDANRPDEIAVLMYTSGTTAEPKGVLHNHRTLGYEVQSMVEWFGLDGSYPVFSPSPLTHITGLELGVLLPAVLGTPTVLLDAWDPRKGADLVEAESCGFTAGATPFLRGLTEEYRSRGTRSRLRVFACGGADVPPALVREARHVLGASVVRVYGSSEFPTFSCGRSEDPLHIAADTDGLPMGPVESRLDGVDATGTGDLLVRGPELFLGYLDPQLNDDAFTDDGFFRTGDLASLDDSGAVVIRGRAKDIIIRNGENISAKEIEDLLYEHPSVAEVAVVAAPSIRTGEQACAVVVPAPGSPPTLAELCAHLEAKRLARQKLPERLELVDALPKTPSGKIQKFLLRQQLREVSLA